MLVKSECMKSVNYPITSALIDGGFTYPEFVQFTEQLVQENRTTGANQSEEYLGYTRLNLQRMGFTDVRSLAGGITEWANAGLPVTQR